MGAMEYTIVSNVSADGLRDFTAWVLMREEGYDDIHGAYPFASVGEALDAISRAHIDGCVADLGGFWERHDEHILGAHVFDGDMDFGLTAGRGAFPWLHWFPLKSGG